MSSVFIYTLNCPITGAVRYVGKSENPIKRFKKHLCSKEKNHRGNWIRSLREDGWEPTIEIIDEVPEAEWQSWEVAYVLFFRDSGFNLVNSTAGGEGLHNPGNETREKLSISKIGIKNPYFGKHTWSFGKKMSLEFCAKNRASHLGKTHSDETKRKMSLARSGEKHPDFGKKFSPERCAAMSILRLGKALSPEHCANISASLIGNKYRLGKKPWNFGKRKAINGGN